jgi:hypothetical protein
LDSFKEKEYVIKLADNLEILQKGDKKVSFIIVEKKSKGFTIKVAGLFAYVSYFNMPWKYSQNNSCWNAIANSLIDKVFFCNINQITRNPIFIDVDARVHQFREIELIEKQEYKGIIISKAAYGIFVDIGYHFGWKFGSIIGLIHKSNIEYLSYIESKSVGKEITSVFYGYNADRAIMLGDQHFQKEWHTGKINELLGTTQEVRIIIDKDGKRMFQVNDKYKGSFLIAKSTYSGLRDKARKFLNSIPHNEVIPCKVTKISRKKNCLMLVLDDRMIEKLKSTT